MELAQAVNVSAARIARVLIDLAGAAALVAIALNAPFQFCRQGICYECRASFLFDPPIRGAGVLCAVHWEQLLLRLAAVALVWALARYALHRLSR